MVAIAKYVFAKNLPFGDKRISFEFAKMKRSTTTKTTNEALTVKEDGHIEIRATGSGITGCTRTEYVITFTKRFTD